MELSGVAFLQHHELCGVAFSQHHELNGVAFLQHQLNGVSFSQHDHNNVTVGKLRGKRAPRASLAKRPERYYGLCLCVRIILYVKNKLKNLIGLCSTSVYRISYLG